MPQKKKPASTKSKPRRSTKQTSWLSRFMSQKNAKPILFIVAFAIIGTATLIFTLAASSAGPIKGIGGKCLYNSGNRLKVRNKIQLLTCNGSAAQKWTVKDDGTIHLTDKYCLDVKYRGTTPGTPVWLWTCNGTVAQQWKVNTDGTIVNPHSGLCLDDKWSKTDDGNPIWMYTCNGTAAQKWTVTKSATSTPSGGTNGSGGSNTGGSTGGSGSGTSGGSSGSGGGSTGDQNNAALCDLPKYPSAATACTGVPANTTLTVVNGDQTYDSKHNGETVTGKDFHGFVKVTGTNITFKNCVFRGRAYSGNNALLDTSESSTAGTVTVQDSEFVPSNPAATIDGLWTRRTNLYRVNVHGSVDGIKAYDNTLVQDSYIHDMKWFSSDPNQGGGPTHNDGVQTLEGSGVTLRHNAIDLSGTKDSNSAWQVTQDFGPASNLHAENNFLDGGGCTLNFAHKNGPAPLTGIYILNNHFGRHQAYSGCAILISTKTVLNQNSGNVWNDTGASIPVPQQHD